MSLRAPRENPSLLRARNGLNWIDRFVFAKLKEKELAPSPDADRITLVRRLHFDLTGLPPRPEEVESFVKDGRQLDKVVNDRVDDLLARSEYGERMATYWLDLVRFASTVGYHGDQDHPAAPYRNYVIDSFNSDLPSINSPGNNWVATCSRLRPISNWWPRVTTVCSKLLMKVGFSARSTLPFTPRTGCERLGSLDGGDRSCAQCHDHKYDPYTIGDFYKLSAFFADIHDDGFTGNSLPTVRPPYLKAYPKRSGRR